MTDCSGVIEIRQNRLKHLALVLLGLLAVLASYHLLTGDFSGSDFARRVEFLRRPVGISGIVFFGACTIYAVYTLFKLRNVLVIGPAGVYRPFHTGRSRICRMGRH